MAQTESQDKMTAHWMDHYASRVESEFAHSTLKYENQYTSSTAEKEADDRTKNFVRLMQEYQGALDLPVDFDVYDTHSWDEVMQSAREAENKYHTDASWFRKFVRGIGDYAPGIAPWITLLPNDSYMSAVSGSLKLMLAAAERRSEQREKILQGFRIVPETLSKLQECRSQFHTDTELREYAFKVYISLLDMIEGLIKSLVSEKIWKKIKFGVIGDRKSTVKKLSKLSVDQLIARCEGKVRDFNSRVETLTRTSIVETATTVKRLKSITDITRTQLATIGPNIVQTEALSNEIHSTTQSIQNQTGELCVHVQSIGSGIEDIKMAQCSMMITREEMMESMRGMLKDVLANNEWRKVAEERRAEAERLRLELVRTRTSSATANAEAQYWLLNVFAIDPESPRTEAMSMLRQGQALDDNSSACVMALFRNRRFKQWMGSGNADALLIEGCSEGHELSRYSPLTLASALLAETLSQQAQARVIHFFCGAHNTATSNTHTGGNGMIRSLLTQLLSLQEYDLTFLDSPQWRDGIEAYDIPQLCELFRHLLYQFRGSALFCIIDGISLFEARRWKDDAYYVMGALQHVTQSRELGSQFKLLATCPGMSRDIKSLFPASGAIRLSGRSGDMDDMVAPRALRTEIANSSAMWEDRDRLPSGFT